MSLRSRSTQTTFLRGWVERPLGTVLFGDGPKVNYNGSVVDEVDVSDNRQFSRSWDEISGGRMNGGNSTRKYHNWLADYYRTTSFGHLALSADLGNLAYAGKLCARTTPSRPYVDVPVNILELGEVTSLLKRTGDDLLSFLGSNNLRYQFSIKPLVGDLIKIWNFQQQVDRRVKEIERLRGTNGLRRTIRLGGLDTFESNSGPTDVTVNSTGSTLVHSLLTTKSRRLVGGHVRWKPSVSVKHLSPHAVRMKAMRAVLGLTIDFSTVWQRIPWSWLIDWSSTIGDYLAANRNIIPAYPSSISITRHTRTVLTGTGTTFLSGGGTLTPFLFEKETKDRSPTSLLPTAHFPFLSGNQMGILASLYVTRR